MVLNETWDKAECGSPVLQPLPAGALSEPESPPLPQELGEHSSRLLDFIPVDCV